MPKHAVVRQPTDLGSATTAGDGGRQYSAALLTLATIASGLLNYGYSLAIAAHLNPGRYSQFAGAQALVLITGLVGSVGVPFIVAQEVRAALASGDVQAAKQAVNFAFWANVALGAVASAVIGLLVSRFAPLPAALAVAATIMILALGSTSLGVLQGSGRTGLVGAIVLAEVVVKFAVGVLLVYVVDASATAALVGLLLGSCVLFASLAVCFRDIGKPAGLAVMKPMVVSSMQVGGIQLGVGVIAAVDVYVAATIGDHDAAAGYQIASTVGKMTLFVSSAVSFAAYPLLTGPDPILVRLRALKSYLLLAGALVLALLSVPNSLIRAVVPKNYVEVAHWLPYTAFLGLGVGFANLVTTFVQSYQADGGRGAVKHTLVMGPLLVVALAAMLVGAHVYGVRGLAVSSVASAWLVAVVYGALRTERAALARLVRYCARDWLPITVLAVLGSLLFVTQQLAAVWLINAIVLGAGAAALAFPEIFGKEGVGGAHELDAA